MRDALSAEALEFAPGLLSIQETPPARLPRALLGTVGLLSVILLLWAIFGKLDIIASAEGRLVPESSVKIVQPAEAGIVQAILVKEGEAVKAGQVLMRMDALPASADARMIADDMVSHSLQMRRIDAELNGTTLARKRDDPVELFRQVEAQYRDHRQAYADTLEQLQQALIKAQLEHDAAVEVQAKLQQTLPIFRQAADSYVVLGRDGYAPKVMVQDKQREYLEKAQDMRAQQATVASLDAAVNQARKQLHQVTSTYRSDLRNERIEAQKIYRKLEQDWVKQVHKKSLLELKAPQAGIVKDLATHTIGTVVSPGTVLLSLVPAHDPLVAEILVKNDDVGFVFVHQKVKVKLAPYPFQKYGMLDGEVIRIQADSESIPQSPDRDRSGADSMRPAPTVYRAIISLGDQFLAAEGRNLKLVSGMQVVAEINQGERSVLKYLLSPISRTLEESGHER